MRIRNIRFWRDQRAVAAIEFALIAPLLILLIAGTIELTRYVLANQKIDKSANSLSDYVSQLQYPNRVNMDQLFETFSILMEPFETDQTSFIVSVVHHQETGRNAADDNDDPVYVQFQQRRGGLAAPSKVGGRGSVAAGAIPELDVQVGEHIVVVEVFYRHRNILSNIREISTALDFEDGEPLYKAAYFRQRQVPTAAAQPPRDRPEPPVACCGFYCTTPRLPTCACSLEATNCIQQDALDNLLEFYKNDPVTLASLENCSNVCPPRNANAIPYCDRPGNADDCQCNPANCGPKGEVGAQKSNTGS